MWCRTVVSAFVLCLLCDNAFSTIESVTEDYVSEPVGNLMDINWKLPKDGGGGNTQCTEDIRRMYNNLKNMTLWAFQMWAATASGVNGWTQGSVYQFGNFDECIGSDDPGVERQYCLATINITQHPKHKPIRHFVDKFGPYQSIYDLIYYTGDLAYLRRDVLHWGICSPASCSREELQDLLQRHIDSEVMQKALEINKTNSKVIPKIILTLPETLCQVRKQPEPFSAGALTFFWLIGLMCLIVMSATIYHTIEIHKNNDSDAECHKTVTMFSAIANLKSLKKGEDSDDNGMDVLWGIRFLSMFFIINAHNFGTTIASSILNRSQVEEHYHKIQSMLVSHSDVVVDSFFALSGILSVHGILKSTKNLSVNGYLVIILHRYIRLTAAYVIVILWVGFVLPHTGSGPTWPSVVEFEGLFCRENWWLNLLMLNNYIKTDRLCMAHSWYIPCDFHYFLISLVICRMLKVNRRNYTALSVLSILIVISMLIPAVLTYIMRTPGTMLFYEDFLTNPREYVYFKYIYITSHNRASPHLIGILAGYLILKYYKPGKKLFSTVLSTIGGVVSIGVLTGLVAAAAVFYEPDHPYSVLESSFFAALHRAMWGAALCSLILCCVFGQIPLISSFLSWSPWVPLGKLVYGAYLVHMGLQIRRASLVRAPYDMDVYTMLVKSAGDFTFSFLLSLVLYLLIEAPVRNISVHLIYGNTKRQKRHSIVQDSYTSTTPVANVNKALNMNDDPEGGNLKNNLKRAEVVEHSKNTNKEAII